MSESIFCNWLEVRSFGFVTRRITDIFSGFWFDWKHSPEAIGQQLLATIPRMDLFIVMTFVQTENKLNLRQ